MYLSFFWLSIDYNYNETRCTEKTTTLLRDPRRRTHTMIAIEIGARDGLTSGASFFLSFFTRTNKLYI